MSDAKKFSTMATHIEKFQAVPRTQSIIWTVAPKGRSKEGNLRVSVIVSPRLQIRPMTPIPAGTPPEAPLSYFPDFADWPTWLEQTFYKQLSIDFLSQSQGGKSFTAAVKSLGKKPASGAARGKNAEVKLLIPVSDLRHDPALWQKVFPPATRVRSFESKLDTFDIDPAALDNRDLERHIEELYGRCGVEFTDPPPIDRLADMEYFGALIKEMRQITGAPQITAEIAPVAATIDVARNLFGAGPGGGAQTMSLKTSIGGSKTQALTLRFKTDVRAAYKHILKSSFSRKKTVVQGKGLSFQPYDFHEIIGILLSYPGLLRKLGLIIDLEVENSADIRGSFNAQVTARGLQGESWKYHAAPKTACTMTQDGFFAKPLPNSGLTADGMLAFDNADKYKPVQTDTIGSGYKSAQFAAVIDARPKDGSGTALPAERTAGISISMKNRIDEQRQRFQRFKNELEMQCFTMAGKGWITGVENDNPPLLYADDLARGLRVDAAVFDDAAKKWKWHSLCRQDVRYFIGNDPVDCSPATGESPDAEGVVTTGLVKQPAAEENGAQEQYQMLESLFRWTGWSLCVPPPKTDAWPLDACDTTSSGAPVGGGQFGLNVRTRVTAACDSLPLLRFGKKYRLRARVADLAGNSRAWNIDEAAHATREIVFRRYEPVPTPIVIPVQHMGGEVLLDRLKSDGATKGQPHVLQVKSGADRIMHATPVSPGESLETLVIRSNYDTPNEYAPTRRHFALPRTTIALAEYHGMFDSNGRFDPLAAKHITEKFNGNAPAFEPGDAVTITYLADPLARGVTFVGLPGSQEAIACEFGKTGSAWPANLKSLRVTVKEGKKPPERMGNELTIYLPKAEMVRVSYSSLIGEGDLDRMAQWERMQQYTLNAGSGVGKLITNAKAQAVKGLHFLLTPRRELVLVHAVKQPMEVPVLVPVFDPHNRKKNTLRREPGATWAHLDGVIQVHGKSTGSIDVYAQWTELIDDPVSDAGVRSPAAPLKQHVLRAEVHLNGASAAASSGGVVNYMEKPGTGGLFLGTYINDAVVSASGEAVKDYNAAAYELANAFELKSRWSVKKTQEVAARLNASAKAISELFKLPPPRHEFGDTKHRKLVYQTVGTTRFREYFEPMRGGATALAALSVGKLVKANTLHPEVAPSAHEVTVFDPEAQFRRIGPKTMEIHIPSSARPAPARIAYAIPTFGWRELKKEGNKLSRTRKGNGIRVFVEGPWFSSGEDELLGAIVLPESAGTSDDALKPWRPYVSQWGRDPLWKTAQLPSAVPTTTQFKGGRETAHGLSLVEREADTQADKGVSVVGYHTTYDKGRRLWYADIEMNPGNVYFPFVRLALARYQPYSVKNAHLSATTLSDFIQLLPDRTATVVMVSQDLLKINVTGVFCDECYSQVETTLEMARDNVSDDVLKWEPVSDPALSHGFVGQQHIGGHVYSCSGNVSLPAKKAGERYRIVIKETEQFISSAGQSVKRLVYADAFELD